MSQQQWQQYPNLPWMLYQGCGCARGGFTILDTRTNQQYHAPDEIAVHQFAADHSGQGSRVRLGDAVHGLTKRLGLNRCSSCAQRQVKMNRWFG